MTSFYSGEELKKLGLASFGENIQISRYASIYSPEKLRLGSNVRIDDFCILSGTITLGSFVHISAYTALFGSFGITVGDYSGLSPRCTVFSAVDDFSGEYMIGPLIPKSHTRLSSGKVRLANYVQIGANSIVFPNIHINDGVAVGALSLVKQSLPPWTVYAGNPLKFIKARSKNLLGFENLE